MASSVVGQRLYFVVELHLSIRIIALEVLCHLNPATSGENTHAVKYPDHGLAISFLEWPFQPLERTRNQLLEHHTAVTIDEFVRFVLREYATDCVFREIFSLGNLTNRLAGATDRLVRWCPSPPFISSKIRLECASRRPKSRVKITCGVLKANERPPELGAPPVNVNPVPFGRDSRDTFEPVPTRTETDLQSGAFPTHLQTQCRTIVTLL